MKANYLFLSAEDAENSFLSTKGHEEHFSEVGIPVKYALKELVSEFRHESRYCDRIGTVNFLLTIHA